MSELGYECCICGNKFTGWGNNPWPVVTDENARCCDDCNSNAVIPARLAKMFNDTTPKNMNEAIGRR